MLLTRTRVTTCVFLVSVAVVAFVTFMGLGKNSSHELLSSSASHSSGGATRPKFPHMTSADDFDLSATLSTDGVVSRRPTYEGRVNRLRVNYTDAEEKRQFAVVALDQMLWLHPQKTGTIYANTFVHWSCGPQLPANTKMMVNDGFEPLSPELDGCKRRWRKGKSKKGRSKYWIGEHYRLGGDEPQNILPMTFFTIREPRARLVSAFNYFLGETVIPT